MTKTDIKMTHPRKMKEGAGAEVLRLFPGPNIEHFDPFVLLDEFFVEPDAGFPMHEHGGFEAITYIIEGGFRHKDTMGNDSEVSAGGVQKFNAGSCLKHEEMPAGDKKSHGFQLWINLPLEFKDSEPNYQKLAAEDVPVWEEEGIKVKTIVGEDSPIELHADVLYMDVHLEEGAVYDLEIPSHFNGILYIYEGSPKVNGKTVESHHAILLKDKGELDIMTDEDSKFLIIAGKPLNEPIIQRGSFVE